MPVAALFRTVRSCATNLPPPPVAIASTLVWPTSPGPMRVHDLPQNTAPEIAWLLKVRVALSSRKTALAEEGHTRSVSRDPVCFVGTLWPQVVMLTSALARLQATASNVAASITTQPDFEIAFMCPPVNLRSRVHASRFGRASVYRGRSRPVKKNPSTVSGVSARASFALSARSSRSRRGARPRPFLRSPAWRLERRCGELRFHRAGRYAPVVVEREGDDAVAVAHADNRGRVGPLEAALLAKTLLVVELHPPDAPEHLRDRKSV